MRFLLTTHIVSSVGWLGAVLVFLAHAVVSVASDDAFATRAAAFAMGIAAWAAVMPLALASLATGLVQALATPWGLLRHYWVVAKLVLTALATAVLLLKMGRLRSWPRRPRSAAFIGRPKPADVAARARGRRTRDTRHDRRAENLQATRAYTVPSNL